MYEVSMLGVLLTMSLAFNVTGHAQEAAEPLVGDQNLYVTLYLEDGSVLEGHILVSDENAIAIEPPSGGKIIIPRDGIKEIKQDRLLASTNVESKRQQYEKPPLSVGRFAGEILAGGALGTVLSILGGKTGFEIGDALSEDPSPRRGFIIPILTDAEIAGLLVGLSVGWMLGNTTGVYAVGASGNVTGSFLATLGGSILGGLAGVVIIGGTGDTLSDYLPGDAIVTLLFAAPAIGAVIGFNVTRRYESPPAESEVALINFRDGQMNLAVPRVRFLPDSFGRGGLCQNVDLLRVRF